MLATETLRQQPPRPPVIGLAMEDAYPDDEGQRRREIASLLGMIMSAADLPLEVRLGVLQ